MDVNQKAKELAYYIKGTREFKNMNKYKEELEKSRSLKKHLDAYLSKKNQIYSKYKIDDANKRVSKLNDEYSNFFNDPIVNNYMNSTNEFNSMMKKVYSSIEDELLK
ncbi:YlbF family regulator [Terrisporobacter sp.]